MAWAKLTAAQSKATPSSERRFDRSAAREDEVEDFGAGDTGLDRFFDDLRDDAGKRGGIGAMLVSVGAEHPKGNVRAGGLPTSLRGVIDRVDRHTFLVLGVQSQDGRLGLDSHAWQFGQSIPSAGALAAINDRAEQVPPRSVDRNSTKKSKSLASVA